MRLKITFFTSFIFTCLFSFGQDIHFSQYYASPLSVSPANTGNYSGDLRVMANYRRQWGSFSDQASTPFTTMSLGVDKVFFLQNNDRVSGGLYIVNDKSSPNKLVVNKFFASGAYHKKFGKHNLGAGLQVGFVNKSLNTKDFTYPEDWDIDNGNFNSDYSNSETASSDGISYLDFNVGATWSSKFGNFEPFATISAFHINSPKESYLDKDNKLPIRKAMHFGGKYTLKNRIFITPSIFTMSHAKASNLLIGSNVGLIVSEKIAPIRNVFGGVYFRDGISRNPDALIVVVGGTFYNFEVGLSYDLNVSELHKATNYKGGLELSLIYIIPSTKLTKITIPCERY
jgi:type IX secretion system PorP/SprF family membrane protein